MSAICPLLSLRCRFIRGYKYTTNHYPGFRHARKTCASMWRNMNIFALSGRSAAHARSSAADTARILQSLGACVPF